MEKIIKPSRLAALAAVLLGLVVIYVVNLYRLQIVKGEQYLEQSQSSRTTESVVPAARGNILDRYGRVLVSNRVCNNLTIDDDELFEQEDPNTVILELVQAVEDSGAVVTDELPITKEPPFEFTPQMSSLQRTRLEAYLKEYDLPDTTTAVELMAVFRDKFAIDNNYTAQQMRTIAGVRYEIKIRYIIGTSEYIFAKDVSIDLITKLMEQDVPGFKVENSYTREYNTDYAAHILGYIGLMDEEEYKQYRNFDYPLNAMVGKAGAEKAFETYLHGTDGVAMVTSTPGGTEISTVYTKEPDPGNNTYLTLDIGLQAAAELSLNSYIDAENAQRQIDNEAYSAAGRTDKVLDMVSGGAVVVISVKTGEPLCIASAPTFDLDTLMEDYEDLLKNPYSPMFNRALSGAYAPGSTFKPCTAIAVLDQRIIDTLTTICCTGQYMEYAEDGYAPKCWIYPGRHGDLNLAGAVENSCNYYFYTVSEKLGIDKMSDYASRFGLGEATGIELPENTGIMSTQQYKHDSQVAAGLEGDEIDDWYIGDTIQAGIGQAYSQFTPLQLANYCAAIANNGLRYEASLLKSVRSYDYSRSVYTRQNVVAGDVDVEQAYYDAVHLGMYNVVHRAVGSPRDVFTGYNVEVAAKTGTAQIGEGITNNAVFICYAPYSDPEIAVSVVMEKGYAGANLAKIAKDVLDYYFTFKNSTAQLETENYLLK